MDRLGSQVAARRHGRERTHAKLMKRVAIASRVAELGLSRVKCRAVGDKQMHCLSALYPLKLRLATPSSNAYGVAAT